MSAGEGIDLLWRASWQGGLFAAVVWLVCRVPRLPAAWRCWLWWLVCLRLLVGLLDLPPVRLALLPAPAPVPRVSLPPVAPVEMPAAMTLPAPRAAEGFDTALLLLGAWVGGVLVRLGLGTHTLLRIRRLRKGARVVETAAVREEVTALGAAAGIRSVPPVLSSPAARRHWSPVRSLPRTPSLDIVERSED